MAMYAENHFPRPRGVPTKLQIAGRSFRQPDFDSAVGHQIAECHDLFSASGDFQFRDIGGCGSSHLGCVRCERRGMSSALILAAMTHSLSVLNVVRTRGKASGTSASGKSFREVSLSR
jgi:hypothetical protein